jgi:glycosyltransferase involved in cell wall biosynthesis
MVGRSCAHCGARLLSPRLVCPVCRHEVTQLAQHIFPALDIQSPAATQEPVPVVTVVIPAYNAAATIRATLDSVMAQDFDGPYEVIVVDSSSDDTAAIVSRDFPQVHLIHRDRQTDPGTARNLAIARARGEIIACLDADCAASPDWLRRMVAAHRAGHPVVGGSVENGNPEKVLAWASFLGEFREFVGVGEPRLVRHVPTCNISYDCSIFARFGGFPTSFYPQEDLLFHWRLGQQGIPIWFEPDIKVKHTHRAEWWPYLRHQCRIGHITAQVLELTGDEGAFLARAPLLTLLAAPFLPLVKFFRTVTHFANWQPTIIRRHWAALLFLLLGLYAWVIGFVAGAWDDPLRVPLRESLSHLAVEQSVSQ